MENYTSFFNRLLAFLLLILTLPLWPVLYLLVKLDSKGSFIFKQKRLGKDKKPFMIYKIRTMINNAAGKKSKLKNLNEADEPAFKIRHDPRYTKFGKLLAHSGLDELPQLINVIKGNMNFVGPRPLPVVEAKKVAKKYERRFSVRPGITSLWVIRGTDHSSFDRWMKLDLEYVKKKSFFYDARIFFQTIIILFFMIKKQLNYGR